MKKSSVSFLLPQVASPPRRKGPYQPPRPIKDLSLLEKIKIRDRHHQVHRNTRLLDNVSIVRFKIRPTTPIPYFFPLPLELEQNRLPPSMRLVHDQDHDRDVLEEMFPDGSIIRYRIYSKKTGVDPSSRSFSGLSRLASFYRHKDKLRINDSHTLWITPDNNYFSIWKDYVMDDNHHVLYPLQKTDEKKKTHKPSHVPFGHMRSILSMTDYFMHTYGITEENARKMAYDIKALTLTTT